jgi:hypothetical protein
MYSICRVKGVVYSRRVVVPHSAISAFSRPPCPVTFRSYTQHTLYLTPSTPSTYSILYQKTSNMSSRLALRSLRATGAYALEVPIKKDKEGEEERAKGPASSLWRLREARPGDDTRNECERVLTYGRAPIGCSAPCPCRPFVSSQRLKPRQELTIRSRGYASRQSYFPPRATG